MSTEFTAGIGDGARISSKVLKPPGGGSSDIFGFGGSDAASDNCNSEKAKAEVSTKSRLFGDPSDPLPPKPNKNTTLHQSSIFDHEQAPVSRKKMFVRRNPITGEEIEVSSENGCGNDCDNKEKEEKTPEASPKPVQTSIRVRNPPGGKSSGIF